MTLIVADHVRESTTTTGTGPITLAGATTGYRAFSSVCADQDTVSYEIAGGSEWETGIGTYTASGTTLARTTVIASSNANAVVNLSAGTKTVTLVPVAKAFPYSTLDIPPGTPNVADDEFSTGSSIDTTGSRFSGANAWTARSITGLTNSVSGGELVLTLPQTSSFVYEGYTQAYPASGDCTYRVKAVIGGAGADYHSMVVVIDRGTGVSRKTLALLVGCRASNTGLVTFHRLSTESDTDGGTVATLDGFGAHIRGPIYFEIAQTSTNIALKVMPSTFDRFYTLATEAQATWLGGRPDAIGLAMLNGNAGAGDVTGTFAWFRRVA